MTKRIGPRMRAVVDYVTRHPGRDRADVARSLGMPYSSACSAIRRAIEAGLIDAGRRGSLFPHQDFSEIEVHDG